MTTDDLARLRSLAEAATKRSPRRHRSVVSDDGYRQIDYATTVPAKPRMSLDPQTVLALLDQAALGLAYRKALEGARDSLIHIYSVAGEHLEGEIVGEAAAALDAIALALADKMEAREP